MLRNTYQVRVNRNGKFSYTFRLPRAGLKPTTKPITTKKGG